MNNSRSEKATDKTNESAVGAWRDLTWFSSVFAFVVGGPSILSIYQSVFIDHQLVSLFQWIVDGYNQLVGAVAGLVEPPAELLIQWLNSILAWDLQLGAHWRPVFVLAMIVMVSFLRYLWLYNNKIALLAVAALMAIVSLLAALMVGSVPLNARWWLQGLSAAAPAVMLFSVFLILSRGYLWRTAIITSGLLYVLGAALAAVPGFERGAGVVALGLVVLGSGFWVRFFLKGHGESTRAVGVTILGGFLAAGIILTASELVKLLSR